ncbi:NADPH:quinone reductase-like Zn-dependent oxidoreductase [Rhodobacter sp. JA431]|nr:NADPH:quinone reductase-like Zn-dependent oxidoreductase [Rhodobacter sp. JA431]
MAATGLNFRDAMLARGLLPERLLDGGSSKASLGMEVAGRVLRSGPGTSLSVGTMITGFAAEAFSTHLTVSEAALVPLPDGFSPEVGASLPVAFATAWEALTRVAHLQAGEWVLVHGGAGGVGLAAIQVARLLGARVIASASSPERRALAKASGAEVVVDSRDPDFARAVRASTDGCGVDVVLNSLSGAMMQASVGCLAPFGRFVELGKRDFLERTRLNLSPFAAGLSYHSFDLDRRLARDPQGVRASLCAVISALEEGRLRPLPVTTWPATDIAGAIRHMLAAHHVGKIVLTPPALASRRKMHPVPVRDDWVILGGTGGLGLALARALIDAGAECVHLVSRSGKPGLGSGADGIWAETAPEVQIHAADATDPQALAAILNQIAKASHRLGGVIHAAMILHDRLIRDLDPVETRAVLDAKLGVARALDKALRNSARVPDHLLYLSSMAAWVGNPGQSSYAAGNAAISAFAAAQRIAGLPTQVISLGAVAGGGVLARNAALEARLSRQEGMALMPLQTAVAEVMTAISRPPAEDHLFTCVDWARLAPLIPAITTTIFEQVIPVGAASRRALSDISTQIRKLDRSKALVRVEAELAEILCAILRLPVEDFDPHRPFGRYGIDSLMAMELRLDIERRFGLALVNLPISEATPPAGLTIALLEQLHRDAEENHD